MLQNKEKYDGVKSTTMCKYNLNILQIDFDFYLLQTNRGSSEPQIAGKCIMQQSKQIWVLQKLNLNRREH